MFNILGPVTVPVASRLAELPLLLSVYPNQIAVARVWLGGGNCMKTWLSPDRHAVA